MQSKIQSEDEQSFCCRLQPRTPVEPAVSRPRVFIMRCMFHPDSALLPPLWYGCLLAEEVFIAFTWEKIFSLLCESWKHAAAPDKAKGKLICDINTELNCIFSHSKPSGLTGCGWGVIWGLKNKMSRVTWRGKILWSTDGKGQVYELEILFGLKKRNKRDVLKQLSCYCEIKQWDWMEKKRRFLLKGIVGVKLSFNLMLPMLITCHQKFIN